MTDTGSPVLPGATGTNPEQEQASSSSNMEMLEMAHRLILGLVLLGGDEMRTRLQARRHQAESCGKVLPSEPGPYERPMRDLLGYMAVAGLVRGQRRLAHSLRRGVRFAVGSTAWALTTMDRLTDNPLGRSFRRPFEQRIWDAVQSAEGLVREGQREVEESRLLAKRTASGLTQDLIDDVATSPEVTRLVGQVVGGQSATLAGVVVDGARQVSASADDVAEGLVRRLFRRKPRQDLPPSPVAGVPQTMYSEPAAGGEFGDE